MSEFGIQTTPNADRQIEVNFQGKVFERFPVKTPIVNIGDDLFKVIRENALPSIQPGDFLVMSEKMVSISQNRVVHESQVKVTRLAQLICKYVTKYPDDVGFENPKKMQVAIDQAGYFRMLFAVAIGGVMKFVFGKPGWFYIIAGNDVAAIDGFNPIAVKPFNEYAILSPAEPDNLCNRIETELGIPAAIVDASNITTHTLGKSAGLKYSAESLKQILAGNPMGQGDEQTPMLIIRKRLS